MAAELILAQEAEQDIAEAYAWYEAQRTGLGEEFLHCVDACMQLVCRVPEAYPIVQENYRRALVRRFPFAVFYEHVEESVIVYCVFHTARDPQKWRQRLA